MNRSIQTAVRASVRAAATTFVAAGIAGCSGGTSGVATQKALPGIAPSPTATPGQRSSGTTAPSFGKITHVVFIIQENRTFDNLFQGFPGADAQSYGLDSNNKKIALSEASFISPFDPSHTHPSWVGDYNGGKMNGFDKEPATDPSGNIQEPIVPDYAYQYVEPLETLPYVQLATQYTLADRMFQSIQGPTFPSHQYLVAGTSGGVIDDSTTLTLWGCDAPTGTTTQILAPGPPENPILPNPPTTAVFPCFDYLTMADLLDRSNQSWKYYAPIEGDLGGSEEAYQDDRNIRFSSDYETKVISPETGILTDVTLAPLPAMTWVVPAFENSDHAQEPTPTGPAWVSSVVNAIGMSGSWNSTAIFIVWDDWGGWYDHVSPPQLDDYGLSFRVPLIVVSPYAKKGYVSHVQHEFGSMLKFAEETLDLGSLGTTDVRADDLMDCFDFTKPPSAFTPLSAARPLSFFTQLHATHGSNRVDY
jgi:phospholipase C